MTRAYMWKFSFARSDRETRTQSLTFFFLLFTSRPSAKENERKEEKPTKEEIENALSYLDISYREYQTNLYISFSSTYS